MKTKLFFLFLLLSSALLAQIDNTKNVSYKIIKSSLYPRWLEIKTPDTTFNIYNFGYYTLDYASDDYFVISKGCGSGCHEITVIIFGKEIEYRHYDYPYYANYKEHYFIKRNQDRNRLQAVDFLTGEIFWSRTLANKKNALQVESLTVDVKENSIYITFANKGVFLNPDDLIKPYQPNKTYSFTWKNKQ
ncbi:MAG: hypothetical protein JXL97_03450 [Bacteroidales bacterium]|nr:hypothetical protein [Bacteroidales bacterium]